MIGKIKRIITDRGFGFIETDDGGQVFFHHSGLVDINIEELAVGDGVEFDVEESPKGPRAANVQKIAKKDVEQDVGSIEGTNAEKDIEKA